MRSPRVRFTVRRMMVAVAVVASLMPAIIWWIALERGFRETYAPEESSGFLPPGQAVVLRCDYEALSFREKVPLSRQDFYDLGADAGAGPVPRCLVVAGTCAVIVVDPGDDDDTASRAVAIKLVEGQHEGSVVAVPRGAVLKR